MHRSTIWLVICLCVMGMICCVLWGERDAERALRSMSEKRLVRAWEDLDEETALREAAEETLAWEKRAWEDAVAALQAEQQLLIQARSQGATATDLVQ